MVTSLRESFFRRLLLCTTHNVTRVHDISYSRTAINLRVAIYELERAVHDRRSEYYLFAEMCVGKFLIMVARLSR